VQPFVGGLFTRPQAQAEAAFFWRSREEEEEEEEPAQWIFSPADPTDVAHYGPNYACDGVQTTGILSGPSSATAQRPR
jgi:hypothetical protein